MYDDKDSSSRNTLQTREQGVDTGMLSMPHGEHARSCVHADEHQPAGVNRGVSPVSPPPSSPSSSLPQSNDDGGAGSNPSMSAMAASLHHLEHLLQHTHTHTLTHTHKCSSLSKMSNVLQLYTIIIEQNMKLCVKIERHVMRRVRLHSAISFDTILRFSQPHTDAASCCVKVWWRRDPPPNTGFTTSKQCDCPKYSRVDVDLRHCTSPLH